MLRLQSQFVIVGSVALALSVAAAGCSRQVAETGARDAFSGEDASTRRSLETGQKLRDELSTGRVVIPVIGPGMGARVFFTNPFSNGDNRASTVLGPIPLNTTIYKYVNGTYQIFTMDEFDQVFLPYEPELLPGEGAVIDFPAGTPSLDGKITLNLSGYRPTDDTEVLHALPEAGKFVMLGSARGLATSQKLVTDLGFPAVAGDVVYRFNLSTRVYDIYTYQDSDRRWLPSEPEVTLGEAFFLKGGARPAGSVWREAVGSVPSTFTQVRAILQAKCLMCHSSGGQSPNLSTYSSITGTTNLVVAGNPGQSLLYTVTQSGRMPLFLSPLTAAELQALYSWIEAGAQNN